uniref:Uncharacterized protein K02A2.6-like n=1 Tax=Saccoglossus kowalevskii TaxID=10224 RepID=A0ABM0M4J4_SACKO
MRSVMNGIDDGLVMKGLRLVIPTSLRAKYIALLHGGHPGVEATKRRARDIVFWPCMSDDIDKALSSCAVCNSLRTHQQKSYPVPDLPWSTVATDIFQWNGLHYLVLVDSYSGWFEMDTL